MNKSKGFAISEVMLAVGVVIIFGILAFHAYRDYARRDYFNAIVHAADELKNDVTFCFQDLKTFKGCDSGTHHIPLAIKAPKGSIASLTVKEGVITAVPVAWDGISETDTYILTPRAIRNEITWIPSGGGINHGLAG